MRLWIASVAGLFALTILACPVLYAHPEPQTHYHYHPHREQTNLDDHGFGQVAPCIPTRKDHDWHDRTGSATQHKIKVCCWCGAKRFVLMAKMKPGEEDMFDTKIPPQGNHGNSLNDQSPPPTQDPPLPISTVELVVR